ncbi:hypothetical protein GGI07_003911 [Coemansia sp. Benny D115]|nr:hypothetical protein GGI07_003911 [Coemansia sp. Benny D115]
MSSKENAAVIRRGLIPSSGEGKKKQAASRLDEINGYKVLPVQFAKESTTHYIYFKQHNVPKEDILTPSDRTLYMYNLPADTSERDIRRLLHGTARVARVLFQSVVGQTAVGAAAQRAKMVQEMAASMAAGDRKHGGRKDKASKDAEDDIKAPPRAHLLLSGSSAHVVLLEAEEMAAVLSMRAGVRQWPERDPEDSNPLEYRGLSRYVYGYRASRPPGDLLKKEVDSYMAAFEEAQYERERMLTQQQNVPDEDGFITVVRRGRNTKNSDGANAVLAASTDEAREAGERKKEVLFGNMYRFQVRERKRDQLSDLRKKFEEDKERIARMRQTRQFRPY